MIETIWRIRWITTIAVFASILGATLMFIVGAITTLKAIAAYFGFSHESAFSY